VCSQVGLETLEQRAVQVFQDHLDGQVQQVHLEDLALRASLDHKVSQDPREESVYLVQLGFPEPRDLPVYEVVLAGRDLLAFPGLGAFPDHRDSLE